MLGLVCVSARAHRDKDELMVEELKVDELKLAKLEDMKKVLG